MEELLPATNNNNPSALLRFFTRPEPEPNPLELHESDVVWSFAVPRPSTNPSPPHLRRFHPAEFALSKSNAAAHTHARFFHQSAPVNIPAWPKEFRRRFEDEGSDEAEEEKEMVPPHVIVARSHATFSVFEGAGRTLKGRDLRRVRNAVFQKMGFID